MQKKFFLMSCLIIHVPLLFAASNSKDHGKNNKSKVEAAAAPASAAAAAASAQLNRTSKFEPGFELVPLVPIPKFLKCPVPKGYRAFGCTRNALHQHFCRKDAEKQACEYPIMSLKEQKDEIEVQVLNKVWDKVAKDLKEKRKIESRVDVSLYNWCYLSSIITFEHETSFTLYDHETPHRPESPVPEGYKLEREIDTVHRCLICKVRDIAHQHFEKK